MTRQETVDALKAAALKVGVVGVMTWLASVAPWSRVPIIKGIFQWLVQYILNVAIDKTEMGFFFLYIDVRTSAQGRAFAEAARANREAQMHGTPEQRLLAERALIDSFRAFVRLSS